MSLQKAKTLLKSALCTLLGLSMALPAAPVTEVSAATAYRGVTAYCDFTSPEAFTNVDYLGTGVVPYEADATYNVSFTAYIPQYMLDVEVGALRFQPKLKYQQDDTSVYAYCDEFLVRLNPDTSFSAVIWNAEAGAYIKYNNVMVSENYDFVKVEARKLPVVTDFKYTFDNTEFSYTGPVMDKGMPSAIVTMLPYRDVLPGTVGINSVNIYKNGSIVFTSNDKVTSKNQPICETITQSDTEFTPITNEAFTTKISLKVNKTAVSLKKGKKFQIKTTTTIANDKAVTFKSSKKKIATVSKDGLITAVDKGTCKIVVSYYGKKKKITVTVK